MSLKTILNYSPNFSNIKRKSENIKFIIFHYTGMIKESDAIKKLINIKSEVSSHYLIKNSGEIITLVPDLYVAWHAGMSSWKNYEFLNKYSIGIEITNPGHDFRYKKFSKKQVNSILRLSKFLIKKYNIKPENILGHSDIASDRKKDPGEKFPWKYLFKIGYSKKVPKKFKLNKTPYMKLITKAFQRRFRQELISGTIDQECLIISENLAKKLN